MTEEGSCACASPLLSSCAMEPALSAGRHVDQLPLHHGEGTAPSCRPRPYPDSLSLYAPLSTALLQAASWVFTTDPVVQRGVAALTPVGAAVILVCSPMMMLDGISIGERFLPPRF